jgi:undecaprenyl-diphosphatase
MSNNEKQPAGEAAQSIQEAQQAAHQAVRAETAPRPVRSRRTLIFQFYLLVALAGFSALAVLASTSAYLPVDVTVTKTLQDVRSPLAYDLMYALSWPGFLPQAAILPLLAVVILYFLGLHWEATMTALIVVVEESLNQVVKIVIHRPRPSSDLVHVFSQLSSYSFPSGHVMFYSAFFGFLFFIAFTLLKHSYRRTLLLILFGGLIFLVGFSRIYLGEHWASDVLAGYFLGSIVLTGGVLVYRWGKERFFPKQPVAPEAP